MGSLFFFLAIVFGVLPFVSALSRGRPLQALVAALIAVIFLWARRRERTHVRSATPPPSGARGGISPTLSRHGGQGGPMGNTVLVVDDLLRRSLAKSRPCPVGARQPDHL